MDPGGFDASPEGGLPVAQAVRPGLGCAGCSGGSGLAWPGTALAGLGWLVVEGLTPSPPLFVACVGPFRPTQGSHPGLQEGRPPGSRRSVNATIYDRVATGTAPTGRVGRGPWNPALKRRANQIFAPSGRALRALQGGPCSDAHKAPDCERSVRHCSDIDDILVFLNDVLMPRQLEAHLDNDFQAVREALRRRLQKSET